MRELVVYFSRKGYVKKLAEDIARERGADIFELKTTERTAGFLGFWWCGRFGMHRWGMPLISLPESLESYEKITICSPIWVFSVCAPVREFLGAAAGKIKAAEYYFVHFSPPARYDSAARAADALLGIKRERYTSVICVWGRRLYQKSFS